MKEKFIAFGLAAAIVGGCAAPEPAPAPTQSTFPIPLEDLFLDCLDGPKQNTQFFEIHTGAGIELPARSPLGEFVAVKFSVRENPGELLVSSNINNTRVLQAGPYVYIEAAGVIFDTERETTQDGTLIRIDASCKTEETSSFV